MAVRALPPRQASVSEIERHDSPVELESRLESLPGFRFKSPEDRGPPVSEERADATSTDELPGDSRPDGKPASASPFAAPVGLALVDNHRPAERTGAERCRPEICPRLSRRILGKSGLEYRGHDVTEGIEDQPGSK